MYIITVYIYIVLLLATSFFDGLDFVWTTSPCIEDDTRRCNFAPTEKHRCTFPTAAIQEPMVSYGHMLSHVAMVPQPKPLTGPTSGQFGLTADIQMWALNLILRADDH